MYEERLLDTFFTSFFSSLPSFLNWIFHFFKFLYTTFYKWNLQIYLFYYDYCYLFIKILQFEKVFFIIKSFWYYREKRVAIFILWGNVLLFIYISTCVLYNIRLYYKREIFHFKVHQYDNFFHITKVLLLRDM